MASDSKNKSKSLEGKIAQILTARELVINIGEEHGVKRGMKFAVLAATPIEVRDPETKELLDEIDREKVRVQASDVRAKVTICKTYRMKHVPGGPLYDVVFGQDLTRPPRKTVETLKADDSSYPEPLLERESYVKIGDRAVLVSDN